MAGPPADPRLRIGELADRAGVSQRSLRYYEDQGLLQPHRTPAGHRSYTTADVDRVVQIQELFAAGFCSRGIGQLLPLLAVEPAGIDTTQGGGGDTQVRQGAALTAKATRGGNDRDPGVDCAVHRDAHIALDAEFTAAEQRLMSEKRAIERELQVLRELRQRVRLAPDTHVKADDGDHEYTTTPTTFDHRDRRLR